MLVIAAIPPLWRRVMDPRTLAFRATQAGQVWRHGPTPAGTAAPLAPAAKPSPKRRAATSPARRRGAARA